MKIERASEKLMLSAVPEEPLSVAALLLRCERHDDGVLEPEPHDRRA